MQDHCDAALVVGDAGAVQLVAVLAVRLGREDALAVHRVHVRNQQKALLAGAGERALDQFAGAGARLDPLGHGAEGTQPRLDVVAHALEPSRVGRAGFDEHHVAQRVDHRRLGGACGGEQLVIDAGGVGRAAVRKCGERGKGGERSSMHGLAPVRGPSSCAARELRQKVLRFEQRTQRGRVSAKHVGIVLGLAGIELRQRGDTASLDLGLQLR